MPDQNPNNQLLICFAQPVLSDTKVSEIKSLCGNGINWELFIHQAFAHGLTGLAGAFFEKYNVDEVPDYVRDKLKTDKKSIEKKNLRLAGELVRVNEQFSQAGVRAIPYKGPLLEQVIYKEIGTRMYDDLDLLVREADVFKARDVLISLGYYQESEFFERSPQLYMANECELNFVHSESLIKIELHWRILPASYNIALNYEALAREDGLTNNLELSSDISSADLLIMLISHNGYKHLYDKISWLTDIKGLIIQANINWDMLLLRARYFKCVNILMLGLALTDEMLGLQIPDTLQDRVYHDEIRLPVKKISEQFFKKYVSEPGQFSKMYFRWKTQDNINHKLGFLFRTMFMPTVYDLMWIKIPARFWLLYYVTRPFRLILKAAGTGFRKK